MRTVLSAPIAFVVFAFVALLTVACSEGTGTVTATATAPTPEAVEDYEGLVSFMRSRMLDVVEVGEAEIPCLLVNPKVVLANGGTVEIYEYENAETVGIAVRGILPNRFETADVEVEPYFHYYRGNKLVVRYIGDDAEVIAVLESALGPQFAGDSARINCY